METSYGPREAAQLLGITYGRLSWHRLNGYIPPGAVQIGERSYYTSAQVDAMRTYFSHQGINAKTMAKRLHIDSDTFYRHVREGTLPDGNMVRGRVRYWSEQQVEDCRQRLANMPRKPRNNLRDKITEAGLYSQRMAAEALGMPHITLTTWIAKGRVPRPATRMGSLFYYSAKELELLRMVTRRRYKKSKPQTT